LIALSDNFFKKMKGMSSGPGAFGITVVKCEVEIFYIERVIVFRVVGLRIGVSYDIFSVSFLKIKNFSS